MREQRPRRRVRRDGGAAREVDRAGEPALLDGGERQPGPLGDTLRHDGDPQSGGHEFEQQRDVRGLADGVQAQPRVGRRSSFIALFIVFVVNSK